MKDVKKKLVSDVLDFDKYPSDINQFQSMLSDSEKEVIDGLKHRSNVDVEKNTKEVRERSAKLLNFLIKKLAEKDLPCLLDMTVEEQSKTLQEPVKAVYQELLRLGGRTEDLVALVNSIDSIRLYVKDLQYDIRKTEIRLLSSAFDVNDLAELPLQEQMDLTIKFRKEKFEKFKGKNGVITKIINIIKNVL